MPLINFQTDLTNLPWGRDKRDGGSSNQPYITKDIPSGLESDDLPIRSGPDFIVRGGLKAITNAANDVSRLFQMFTDTKNISAGIGFLAKTNLLSRTSVKSEAGGPGYGGFTPGNSGNTFGEEGDELVLGGGGGVNQGIYTPLSTLGQALGNGLGVHLNLLGINPAQPLAGPAGLGDNGGPSFGGTNLGLVAYGNITNQRAGGENEENFSENNRLIRLNNFHGGATQKDSVNLYSYSGGPGSILGIGKTNLPITTERTGNQNSLNISNPGYFNRGGVNYRSYSADVTSGFVYNSFTPNTATQLYTNKYLKEVIKFQRDRNFLFENDGESVITIGNNGPTQNWVTSVNSILPTDDNGDGTIDETEAFFTKLVVNKEVLYRNQSRTLSQIELMQQGSYIKENRTGENSVGLFPTDFRRSLYTASLGNEEPPTLDPNRPLEGGGGSGFSSVLSVAPDYRDKNLAKRVYLGDPGKTAGVIRGDDATLGRKNVWNYGVDATLLEAVDKINASPMYVGTGPDLNQGNNDLVKFRIAALDNNTTNGRAVQMHFRAFIDSFDDNYSSTWNSVNYVGRGDTLYNYGGFTRNINLSFTVAAQSKAELIPMYKKLNYLASTLTPDYNGAGFMRGNLVKLTLGGYIYEQPGFITSLTYTVPQESNWEIGLNPDGGDDESVKELPHIIKVSGFSFTPIHTFLPSKPKPDNANNPNQKYIALSNGFNNNYGDEYLPYPKNSSDPRDTD